MFELKCFVDDKKLAIALRALDGLVYEPKVLPVRQAATSANGKVRSTAPNGKATEAVITELKKRKMVEVTAGDVQRAAKDLGFSPSSYFYVIAQARKQHLLKRTGKAGKFRYKLVTP